MAEDLPDEEFEAPIHRSLNRSILVMGGERQLVLLLMLLAGIFIVSLAKLWAAIIGVVVWVVGQYGLSQAAKFDPQLSQTGRRLLRFKRFYPASATPFADPPEWKD